MARFNIPHIITAGTAMVAQHLNTNFAALANKFGALTNQDLASGAGIRNEQLANDDYELVLTLQLSGTDLNQVNTSYFIVGGLPYDTGDGNTSYSILGIEHMGHIVTSGPPTAMTFDLDFGNSTDGWTTIKTGLTTPTSGWAQTRVTGFTSTVSTSSARPNFFVLDIGTAGTGYAAGDVWTLAIKLKRTNGLRS